ncbi:uncharacterized protein KZ484_003170 [Pholidichthys leucotaenia]
MNVCTDIVNAELRTGQRNALCIVFEEQELFIRHDNKEIINGWNEQLAVFVHTNKQNQGKKCKVNQELSPSKTAATDPHFSLLEGDSEESSRLQNELLGEGSDVAFIWSVTDRDLLGPEQTPAAPNNMSSYQCSAIRDDAGIFSSTAGSLDMVPGGSAGDASNSHPSFLNSAQASADSDNESQDTSQDRSAEQLLRLGPSSEKQRGTALNREGRSEARVSGRQKSCGVHAPPPQRRSKSLDRRTLDAVMTPDLLNFRKGWMAKLEGNDQWKKYWFVLSTDSLKYYKNPKAEEASDLEGEINLKECSSVSEYQVQKNYDFQIHTSKGVFTLSAMTPTIRKNWIEALKKNVRPANAPDVASLPGHHVPSSPTEALPKPRDKRREERRRRHSPLTSTGDDSVGALSPKSQQRVDKKIEELWRKVEQTVFGLEGTVPLFTEARYSVEMEEMLHSYKKVVEDLKVQLTESEHCRQKLEAQLSATGVSQQQLDPPNTDFYQTDTTATDQGARSSDTLNSTATAPQLPSIWLHDTEGSLQELQDLFQTDASPFLSPVCESQQELSTSDEQIKGLKSDITETHQQLDRVACQSFPTSQTQLDSFCPLSPLSSDKEMMMRLYQEVEILTTQNEALNQHNQEMLNQLTEADREIERLKAELSSRYTEPHQLPEVDEQGKTRLQDLERELNLRNQELLEAQMLFASLEKHLKEAEVMLLQIKGSAEREKTAENDSKKAEGYLRRCFEATEAKLMELENQLVQSELNCRELQQQNSDLKESEKLYHQRAAEAETNIRKLREEIDEKERLKGGDKNTSGEEKVQLVIEGMIMRQRALEKLLDAIDGLDCESRIKGDEEIPSAVTQLKWEEKFWSLLQTDKQKVSNKDQSQQCDLVEMLLSEMAEKMMLEKQMLLVGCCLQDAREGGQVNEGSGTNSLYNTVTASKTKMTEENSGLNRQLENLKAIAQMKTSLLNRVATSVHTCSNSKLHLTVDGLYNFYFSEHPRFISFIQSAATEALYCFYLSTLKSELKSCCSCVKLKEKNRELLAMLADLTEQQVTSSTTKMNVCCQTDIIHLQDADSEQQTAEGRVKELEEQLSVLVEMREEFESKMSSVQNQHEKEMENLKDTFERGLSSMEESHMKVVEVLQCQHQQKMERLLGERDRLLEEERTATATAIKAIENAHREELQKRSQSESSNGSTHLEDFHSEELALSQRELEVLSQQFSLKCLENGHLVQALEAERKALCQCQQENQDLRTKNQELSGHIAAEITRLCSLVKQDALPLSQRMDMYQMEITWRVKESEVQCLKQEIISLKHELQTVQRDKRTVTEKYTELSAVREKAEREVEELRENLRLAHQALEHASQ